EYALPFYGIRRDLLCNTLLHPKDEHNNEYKIIKTGPNSITAEIFTPQLSSKGKHLQSTASLLFDADGEITGAIETLQDITLRKQAEETIQNQCKLFESMLTAMPLPVFYKNAEGKYLGCNQEFAEFTGKSKSDIENHTVYEIWKEPYASLYAEKDQALLDNPSFQHYRAQINGANDEMRDVIFHKSVFFDSEGNVGGIIGVIQDITDELIVKAALQESESKLRAIFNQSFQFTGLVSASGNVLAINQTALDFAGIKEEDIVGLYFPDTPFWKYSKDRNRCIEAIEKAGIGKTVRFQTMYTNAKADKRHIDFSLKPFFDDNGAILFLIAEGRDVTEYVELEEQFRQTQKMEAIGTLAGGIAHDFNNMLFAIQGYNELAYFEAPDNSPVRERLDQSQKAIIRAQNLVKQILAFSRKVDHDREPLELNKEIDEIFQLIHSTLPSTINVHIHLPGQPIYALVDATQLHQVLMNLCTNSA
ncbi:PAS domain-containing protein, partial [bacterium]|nr:PAS domain-containing protein [bacterium]